jgi:DTW domain-containing protein YfiP
MIGETKIFTCKSCHEIFVPSQRCEDCGKCPDCCHCKKSESGKAKRILEILGDANE